MTGGDKDIERGGVSSKIFTHLKGGSEIIRGELRKFIYLIQNQQEGGGLLKNRAASWGEGGAAKISSFEFQYLHPQLVILNELSSCKVCLESWLSFQMIHSKGKELRFCGFSAVIRVLLSFLFTYTAFTPSQHV